MKVHKCFVITQTLEVRPQKNVYIWKMSLLMAGGIGIKDL